MSLAEFFYAKHPRRAEVVHRRRRRIPPRRRRLLFEPLEPRLLLSADPTIFPAPAFDPSIQLNPVLTAEPDAAPTVSSSNAAPPTAPADPSATRVADINPGLAGSDPRDRTVFDNALYFVARRADTGTELWKFDGTTASLAVNAVNDAPSFDLTARVDVTLETVALSGQEGQLAFDLTNGDVAVDNSVVISRFSTDGTLGTASSTGGVSGALPGRTTMSDEEFFNELLQPITFGESVSATLHVTTKFAGGVPDDLSFFIFGPDGTTPLVRTDRPGDALFEIALGGAVSVATSTSPEVPRDVTAPQGPDQAVDEDAGRQVVEGFATGITAGPADEAGQSVKFLVSSDNAALFAEEPAISADGTLSYTPAPDANGAALVTVRLMDDGGTANGGVDTSAAQTFTITVNAVNDAPSFDLTTRVEVSLDTSALAGADGQLAFDLIDGDSKVDNSVVISRFSTDGTLGTASSTGGVSGALPGRTTISDEEFFNELLQPITFGESIVAILHVTTNFAGGAPDDLSFFILGPDGTTPLVRTDRPGDALFEIALGGAVSVATSTSPEVPRDVTAPQGADQAVDEDAGRQVVEAFATRITAGPADEAGQVLRFLVNSDNTGLFAEAPKIAADGTLSYTPAPDANGRALVTVRLMDDGGTANTSAAQTFTITVRAVNDAPVNTVPGAQTVAEDRVLVFSTGSGNAISVADVDAGEHPIQVTLTATNGMLTLGATTGLVFTMGDGLGDPTLTFTGTLADVNAALEGLAFQPAADFNGAASLTVTTNDQGNTGVGGPLSDTDTVDLTVIPVNDAPSFLKGADQAVDEDAGPQVVTGWATAILAGPADEAGQGLTFSGTTLGSATVPGTADIFLAGRPEGTVFLSGLFDSVPAQAPVDAGLRLVPGSALQFVVIGVTDNGGFSADTVATSPDGGSGIFLLGPGAPSVPVGLSGVVTPFNALVGVFLGDGPPDAALVPPTLNSGFSFQTLAPALQQVFFIGDGLTGTGTGQIQSFIVPSGATRLFLGSSDGGGQNRDNFGLFNVHILASECPANGPDDVTSCLVSSDNPALFADGPAITRDGTLSYTPAPDANGRALVTVRLMDDGGTANGGVDTSAAQTFTITVRAVNDAPVNTVPGAQTVAEDTALVFSSREGNAISVADVDAGEHPIQVTLTATNGVLTLGARAGLVFTMGDGLADPTLTFTGTLVDVNAALEGMVFQPAADFNGAASLTVMTNDQGNTGAGGPLSDTDAVPITVTAVNDEPVVVNDAYSTDENKTLAVPRAQGVLANDTDVDADPLIARVVRGPAHGTLRFNADGSFSYTPDLNFFGADVFTYKANDGTVDSADATVAIMVNEIPAFNVDNVVRVSNTGLVLNRATDTFDTQATITNISKNSIVFGPMSLVVTSIVPNSVTLANATGQTADGKPLVAVRVPEGGLMPGASISNILLKFNDPTRVRFTFTTSVLAVDPPADSVAEAPAAVRFSARDAVDGGLRQLESGESAARLVDWSGSFNSSRHAGLGADAPTILRSARPWIPRFLLDLAVPEETNGPKSDIRIVIRPAADLEPVAP